MTDFNFRAGPPGHRPAMSSSSRPLVSSSSRNSSWSPSTIEAGWRELQPEVQAAMSSTGGDQQVDRRGYLNPAGPTNAVVRWRGQPPRPIRQWAGCCDPARQRA
eukprot:25099_1